MLQEVIDLQNRAVDELINLTKENKLRTITFKAPTGSGKTFMMAKFMNEILKERDDVIFLVSTLSKGNLAEQNCEKFKGYKENGQFKYLNPYLIQSESSNESGPYIDETHNVYVLARDLVKNTSLLVITKAFEKFLINTTKTIRIVDNAISIGEGKSIYVIRDECHQDTNKLDEFNDYFTEIFNFSATPDIKNKKQFPNVVITNDEAENAKLIKKVVKGNDSDGLEEAIKVYKNIKRDYIEKLGVNPCLIVQISNKEKGESEIKEIKDVVERAGLKWMYIAGKGSSDKKDSKEMNKSDTNDSMKTAKLSKDKWRDYAKDNSSNIEVIIFKLTISEGWDIPRACMLYQARDTKSEQLNEQVIGRVRRNPCLLNFEKLDEDAKELAMTAYVWANVKDDDTIKNVVLKDYQNIQNEIKIKTTRLKKINTKGSVDVESIVRNADDKLNTKSIFELYRDLNKHNQDIIKMCDDYVGNYNDWFNFTNCIKDISKSYNSYICDYDKSMVLTADDKGIDIMVALPKCSSYANVKENRMGIKDWVWKNIDEDTDFSFDSEAERKWAEVLKELSTKTCDSGYKTGEDRIIKKAYPMADDFEYLWGKNYLQNSEIKYEYYLNGRHFSYPDFIMKDCYNNIHIFEVKSVNKSNTHGNIDSNEYEEKVSELRKCYKSASKLTKNIFYLPVMIKNDWKIYYFKNGIEDILTEQRFKEKIVLNIMKS